jgi:hypothetical protein
MDHLVCGMNDVHFEYNELHLLHQMTRVLNVSFDDQRTSHVNMIKALYYQFFVLGDKAKSIPLMLLVF